MEGRQTELRLVGVSLRVLAGKVSNQCGTDSMRGRFKSKYWRLEYNSRRPLLERKFKQFNRHCCYIDKNEFKPLINDFRY